MENISQNWPKILNKAQNGIQLDAAEIHWSMGQAMTGQATDAQVAALLTALKPDRLTASELNQFGIEMSAHAAEITKFPEAVDIVGTGGDQLNTVNISTMASLVVAASGLKVAKHGNRASSSSTGSADVIEALGVNLNQPIAKVESSIREVGIGFLFAQVFHPSMKYIAPVRKQLGIPTVFNYLGPLTNPAGPAHSVIGVSHQSMLEIIAKAFQERVVDKTLVVRGANGLDEISVCGESTIIKVTHDSFEQFTITPEMFGLSASDISQIKGGFADENARTVLEFLEGKKGAVRDAVLMNAAAGLYVAKYFDQDFQDGYVTALSEAAGLVDSGAAYNKLEQWKSFSAS